MRENHGKSTAKKDQQWNTLLEKIGYINWDIMWQNGIISYYFKWEIIELLSGKNHPIFNLFWLLVEPSIVNKAIG